jgi:hypothetical protein
LGDLAWQMRMQPEAKSLNGLAAFSELGLLPLFDWPDLRREHTATCLHETGAFKRHRCIDAHALNHREEALLDELERRSHRVMRAAFDAQLAGGLARCRTGIT